MMSATEVLDALDGRLTYRMLDYYIRTGVIQIGEKARGSGHHRRFNHAEFLAICDLVDALEQSRRLDMAIRSGELFDDALCRHVLDEMAAADRSVAS